MRPRSLLYVPADNARFIAKAHMRGADAIILDLEDSVRPGNRVEARNALKNSVRDVGQAGALVLVRINVEPDTMLADARAAVAAGAVALYVPKADRARLDMLDHELGGDVPFFALIEHPAALLDAGAIAAHPRVRGLAVGGEDLATALGAVPDPETLRLPKLLVHYSAKAHGKISIGPLGTVADYADTEAMERLALEARRHGFDGATCVHPALVPIFNRAFMPSAQEIAWARRVVEAADLSPAGAFTLDGRMIDAPVVSRARYILDRLG